MAGSGTRHHGFVWHPAVHHYFGEKLHYLLVQFSQYLPSRLRPDSEQHESTRDRLHRLLEDVGAYGHCIYEVFGDADILVRVWLDLARHEALYNRLRGEPFVSAVISFTCDRVEYFWAREQGQWRDISEKEIAEKHDLIVRFANRPAENSGEQVPRDQDVRDLSEAGFLLKPISEIQHDRQEKGGEREIKFFSFFQVSTKLLNQPRHVIALVHDYYRDYGQEVQDLSLYLGNGQPGNCLLKGTTKDYYHIYQLVVNAVCNIDLEASPHTYLAASLDWHESDDLAPSLAVSDVKARRIFAFAGVPFDAVAGLSVVDPRMSQLLQAYDAISPLFVVDDERFLSVLVGGLLDEDERAVKMGCTFLFDIETYIQKYLFARVSKSHFVKNSTRFVARKMAKMRAEALASEKTGKKNVYCPPEDLRECTLKDYAILLGTLCPETDVAGDLGEEWKSQIAKTLDIRNELAHGKFTDLVEEWSDYMKRLAPAMVLYYKLRQCAISENANRERARN